MNITLSNDKSTVLVLQSKEEEGWGFSTKVSADFNVSFLSKQQLITVMVYLVAMIPFLMSSTSVLFVAILGSKHVYFLGNI